MLNNKEEVENQKGHTGKLMFLPATIKFKTQSWVITLLKLFGLELVMHPSMGSLSMAACGISKKHVTGGGGLVKSHSRHVVSSQFGLSKLAQAMLA